MRMTIYLFYLLFGYLSGSVLYSYLIPKHFCHVDVRTANEDQNPGAFNAFSAAGPRVGLFCVLCDIGKGFLPVFLAVYYLMPERLRNGVLTLGSLVFYLLGTWKRPWCLALLLGLMALTWLSGRKLAGSKPLLVGNLLVLGLCLFGFKYAGLLGSGIALPLGLSFYSFQMAAYVIDVYRGRMEPEECPVSYAAEVLMFPKLLSGPLMDPAELKAQMYRRTCTLRELDAGLRDFIIGLSMKVLLANQIGGLWRQVKTIGFESVSTPMAWLGLVAYSLQLYLDFCGYSWMAIGVGEMLGFRLPRNFEHPYAARSMRDFWRRWHISLSSWFRDYVYIPLGGSKKGEGRTYLNLLVVWLFTGLWHGSTLNFLLWGLFLFALISLERLGWGKVLRRSQVISRLYMLLVIPLSWMLFAIPSLKDIGSYIGRLFAFSGGTAVHARDFLVYGRQYAVVLVIGLLVSTPLPEKLWRRIRTSPLGTVLLLVLFWVCVYCMAVATNDPFMYFSF